MLFKQEKEFVWNHEREEWCWQHVNAFLKAIQEFHGVVLLVADEVGMDLVPASLLGRVFRDLNGKVNQKLAAAAEESLLVVAGIPLILKSEND